MSKLSTVQANLAGKTSVLVVTQEASGGSLHNEYKDPGMGILITGANMIPIRFPTDTQANDFAASTGPRGIWPH